MKKIMFNEKYGLQYAAIDGTKPMTRRLVPEKWQQPLTEIFEDCNYDYSKFWQISDVQFITNEKAPYKVGEVVAIAQSYNDIYEELKMTHGSSSYVTRQFFHKYIQKGRMPVSNKMFVKADLMPHRICITNLKIERLQDISKGDCIMEGISERITSNSRIYYFNDKKGVIYAYPSPIEAFAALIDKVSGKGTWQANLWVFAYNFELIK